MATLDLKNINKIYPNGVQAVFDLNHVHLFDLDTELAITEALESKAE